MDECFGEGLRDDMDRVEGRRGRGVGVWVGAEGAEGDMHVAIIVEVGER